MARKKRKAARDDIPPKSSPPLSTAAGKWSPALPALGALALLLAWLAWLGGVSDGAADFRKMFDGESFRPYQIFRDLFLVDGFPASGWAQSGAPFYFPDYAIQWPLFALGVDSRVALYLFALAQTAMAAWGWIYVADFLFGKSPPRRAAILLLHAAPLLLMAYGREDVFYALAVCVFHYGTWATMPWLTGLLLRVLKSPPKPPASAGKIAALVALLSVTAASDKIIIVWFVAPAAFALLCLLCLGQTTRAAVVRLVVALAGGVALGAVLAEIPDIQKHMYAERGHPLNPPGKIVDNLASLADIFIGKFAARNVPEFLAWSLFAAVALWRLASALFGPFARGGLFQVARNPAHLFMAVFIPASAAAAVVAPLLVANVDYAPPYQFIIYARYMIPTIYFALFVGWALIAPPAPAPVARKLAAAACALLAALSAPKIFAVDLAALDPFNTPFHRCYAENAKRLGWTGGLADNLLAPSLEANPNAGVERAMPIYRHQGGPGQSALATNWFVTNRHHFSGEFQFVLLNQHKERAFIKSMPRDESDLCALDDYDCMWEREAPHTIDAFEVRGAFGEPAEIVECEGVAFFHYDPPLHFDFSGIDNPHARILGRPF